MRWLITTILAVVMSSVGAYAHRVRAPIDKRVENTDTFDANGNRARTSRNGSTGRVGDSFYGQI
jgi:hypothetical protein